MRIMLKFSATLLIGIGGILAGEAAWSWSREVQFFEHDMRLDHLVVGDAVAGMVTKAWKEQGRAAAFAVPHAIERTGRHLTLELLDPTATSGADRPDAAMLAQLQAGATATRRDGNFQHSYLPVRGPGDELAILAVREPLTEEQQFSRQTLVQVLVGTLAMVALCGVLTFALGFTWLDRPIRTLCDGARRIGRGDLSGDLRIPGSNELVVLADEMNAMCRSLVQARERLADETERRVATLEQLRHADRLATIGKLAAGVAHELGTPLNVVQEYANMIRRGEVPSAELAESAEAIAAQAARMTTIIRQLLDFARPRSTIKTDTDLVHLARQTTDFLQAVAQRRGVRLQCTGRSEPLAAAVDSAQLQQVLTNLLANAIQATPSGGSVTVEVAQCDAQPPSDHGGAAGRWNRIDVRDTGTGIAPEILLHLFEPFFTTKGVGEGTGLGLSVSRGIVQEHGGWIGVQTQTGAGSCFSVYLPVQVAK